MNEKWDLRFLELAEHIKNWSKDPSTQVGAVVVDDNRHVVSMGYNGFPRGVADDPDRLEDRPTKYKFVVHAEINAIVNAPTSVRGCTLYSPLFPCNECAKAIIQSGIKRVVSYQVDRPDTFNWSVTRDMFAEAGVALMFYEYVNESKG